MFTILIIDDNTPFRHSLHKTLKGFFPSAVIREASQGAEGLKQIGDYPPHLVFMDINLPDINGLNLTRRIKTDHSNTCVVVFTSDDLPEYRTAVFESGADHFAPKDSWTGGKTFQLVESIMSGFGYDRLGSEQGSRS